jgi:hypothetical protein
MTTSPGLRRPPGRYDEPRPLSRPVLLGGAALLVAALVGLALVGWRHYATSRTPYTNLGYTLSERAVVVRFSVVKDAGKTVQCLLQARDRDNAEVGSLVTTIGPDGSGTLERAVSVPTTRQAVAGEVLSCRPAP